MASRKGSRGSDDAHYAYQSGYDAGLLNGRNQERWDSLSEVYEIYQLGPDVMEDWLKGMLGIND